MRIHRQMRRGACSLLAILLLVSAPLAARESVTPTNDDPRIDKIQAELDLLRQWKDDRELEELRSAARGAAEAGPAEAMELRSFKGGERSLQALNPEISFTGDAYALGVHKDGLEYSDAARSGFYFRGVGLHVQSNLDPFSLMKVAVSFDPHGVHFGEAYITWTNVLPRVSLTAGQFRQQLGVINRWHKHGLDQFDFPLMITEPFGGGGLNQAGLSLDWLMPSMWAHENALVLQVTNGQNAKAFSGEAFSVPSTLLRLRIYWDLNRDTYLEFGLTGMVGFNNGRGVAAPTAASTGGLASLALEDEAHEDESHEDGASAVGSLGALSSSSALINEAWRTTSFGGFDLTLSWEPLDRAKYAGVTWRTEGLYARKELANDQVITSMGGYSALDVKVARNWVLGVRGDYAQPFVVENSGHFLWQAAPYVTWWQSPWVRFHLEAQHIDGDQRQAEQRLILQVVFAAGPHKHDRY
jgi:hypothetical protein